MPSRPLHRGWLAIAKLKPLLLFIYLFLTYSNAFLSINNSEMKSEGSFSLAMASQPFKIDFLIFDLEKKIYYFLIVKLKVGIPSNSRMIFTV